MADCTPLHECAKMSGAQFVEDSGWLMAAHFGSPAREYVRTLEQASLFDVSHRGKVEVSGPEAGFFLHNLCTNDVKGLAFGDGCEAFFANLKARVLAHVFIHRIKSPVDIRESYWLDAAPGYADKIVKHLDHYLISEMVEIADRTRDYAQMHLAGPQARSILEKVLQGPLPELAALRHITQILGGEFLFIGRQDALGMSGFNIICPKNQAGMVWRLLLDAGARPAGLETYECLRIEAGTPRYGLDVDENTLVPEVGRIPQTICYTKGCFLGQEPIVRARDLGHVNRTLVGLGIEGNNPIPAGAKLFHEGKEAGQITSWALSPQSNQGVALAYVRRGHTEIGTQLEVATGSGQMPCRVEAFRMKE